MRRDPSKGGTGDVVAEGAPGVEEGEGTRDRVNCAERGHMNERARERESDLGTQSRRCSAAVASSVFDPPAPALEATC